MKIKYIIASIVFGLIVFIPVQAQSAQPQNDLEKTVKQLFELCEKNDFESAANIIVYDGPDKERFLNSFSDYKISSEKRRVNKICKRINALRKMSDEYSIELIKGAPFNNRPVEVARVIFSSGNQQIKLDFQFTRIKGKPGLIDIK